jgi:hypothetical protein
MAAGQDQNICDIFADTDSEYDEEFEGFDINVDDDENMEVIENRDYFFDPENGGKQMTTKENQL